MRRNLLIRNIETGRCGVDEAQEVRKLFDKLDAQIERNGYLSRKVSVLAVDDGLNPDYEGGAGK
jgi:hypothetical protein